ncbi:MAG: YkgJ family cysteine cluster protein [Candidatus Micrarchaeota archaeon]
MRGPCSFCAAECCNSYIITATAFDVLRVIERTKKPWNGFAILHQARLLAFDPDTTLDMEDDGWVYLLGFKSHPCVFLKGGGLCSIHDCAPMACKRFPFQLDGKLNCRFCPLPSQLFFRMSRPSLKAEDMIRELEMHKTIVKEWNKKPGKKADCIPFLLERAESMSPNGGTSSK